MRIPKFESTFKVGKYTCAMTYDGVLRAAWSPHQPKRLNQRHLRAYDRGRAALLARVAEEHFGGRPILVLDA
jgi:hypothetical protein